MSEEKNLFNKFEVGYRKSDMKKNKYRAQIKQHMKDKELFVAPVQSSVSGQYRSGAYKIIHPIYRSNRLTDTLANCFSCSKCDHIFFNLPGNGTGPFTSHKCYKDYITALKKAEIEAAQAEKTAAEATNKAKTAKKSVEALQKMSSACESSSSDEEYDNQSKSNPSKSQLTCDSSSDYQHRSKRQDSRPLHAEVLANTIESFVIMALKGKPVNASDIIDKIPSDFSKFSW